MTLSEYVDLKTDTLIDAYDKLPFDLYRKRLSTIVHQIIRKFSLAKRIQQTDVIIPFHVKTLKDPAVKKEFWGNEWKYKWNEDSEFVNGEKKGTTIKAGTYVDRFGKNVGKYLSPVSSLDKPYTMSERAIPYHLGYSKIIKSPNYHIYLVKKDINEKTLTELKNANIIDVKSDKCDAIKLAQDALSVAIDLTVYEGTVAPVPAFGEQGTGGAIQYRLPIRIGLLDIETLGKEYGFLQEVKITCL